MRLAFPIEKNGGGLEFGLHHPFYKKRRDGSKKKNYQTRIVLMENEYKETSNPTSFK